MRQLEQIRAERWATSVGEREEGVSAAATADCRCQGPRCGRPVRLCANHASRRGRLAKLRQPLEECAAEIGALLKSG